jgi:hypothetical protein
MDLQDLDKKLDLVLTTLKRIEDRQIAVRGEIQEIEQQQAPTVGSFSSVEEEKK